MTRSTQLQRVLAFGIVAIVAGASFVYADVSVTQPSFPIVCNGSGGSDVFFFLNNTDAGSASVSATLGLLSNPTVPCTGIQFNDGASPEVIAMPGHGSGAFGVDFLYEPFTSEDCGLTVSVGPGQVITTTRSLLHIDLAETPTPVTTDVAIGVPVVFPLPVAPHSCDFVTLDPTVIDLGNVLPDSAVTAAFSLLNHSSDFEFFSALFAPPFDGTFPAADASQGRVTFTTQGPSGTSGDVNLVYTPQGVGPIDTAIAVETSEGTVLSTIPITGFSFGLATYPEIPTVQAVVGAGPTPYAELDVQSGVNLTSLTIATGNNGSNGVQIAFEPNFQMANCQPPDSLGGFDPTICNFNEGYTQIGGDSPLLFTCTASSQGTFMSTLNFVDAAASEFALEIDCQGIAPQFSIDPPQLQTTGPELCVGDTTFSQIVTLTSVGGGEENVTGFVLSNASGGSYFDFDWSAEGSVTLGNNESTSGNLTLTNDATTTPGTYSDVLTWMVNPSPEAPVAATYTITTTAVFATMAAQLDFPPTALNVASDQHNVLVHVCGSHVGTIHSVTSSDPAFSVVQSLPIHNVSSDTNVGFSVIFKPEPDQGSHQNQTLTVTYNDDADDLPAPIVTTVTVSGSVQGEGTDAGPVSDAAVGSPDAADAGPTGNGATTSYYEGCNAADSRGGTGAVLVLLAAGFALRARRRKVVSQAS